MKKILSVFFAILAVFFIAMLLIPSDDDGKSTTTKTTETTERDPIYARMDEALNLGENEDELKQAAHGGNWEAYAFYQLIKGEGKHVSLDKLKKAAGNGSAIGNLLVAEAYMIGLYGAPKTVNIAGRYIKKAHDLAPEHWFTYWFTVSILDNERDNFTEEDYEHVQEFLEKAALYTTNEKTLKAIEELSIELYAAEEKKERDEKARWADNRKRMENAAKMFDRELKNLE